MKKRTVVIILISLFLVSFHNQRCNSQNQDAEAGTFTPNDSLPEWAGKLTVSGTLRVAVPAPDNDRIAHLSWPKAVITDNGTIVLAYIAGVGHNMGGSGPAVSISEDGGDTFSHPKLLSYYPDDDERYRDCGNLALGVADDGSVILLAMTFRGNKANNIFGWRSTDNGRSWTTVNTSELGPETTGSVCGRIVQLPGDKLMVMGHYRMPNRKHFGIWQSVSKDNGQTWGAPEMVTNIIGVEPVLVRAEDRLLVFIRGFGAASTRQYITFSDDFGKTWHTKLSSITAQNEHTNLLAHPFAMVNSKQKDEILALTVERPLPGSIWLWFGDSKNLNFKVDRKLMEIPKIEGNPNTDYGYPWLLPVENNRYLMFYYHGKIKGRSSIWMAEFDL